MKTEDKEMKEGRFTKCINLKKFMGKEKRSIHALSIECTLFLNGFVAAVLLIRFCHIFPELVFPTRQRKIH
jgi:hypothetical protein